MTTAPIGSMPKVSGIRIAIPADGPKPGMIPTTMPTSAPIIRNTRLVGVSATDIPSQRSANRSIGGPLPAPPGRARGGPAHQGSPSASGGIDAFSQRSNSRNSASGKPRLMATFCSGLPRLSVKSVASR